MTSIGVIAVLLRYVTEFGSFGGYFASSWLMADPR